MKEQLKIFESKKKIFSRVSYSRALIGQDSDSCETLRSRQIFAPSLHSTYFLILSAPTISPPIASSEARGLEAMTGSPITSREARG